MGTKRPKRPKSGLLEAVEVARTAAKQDPSVTPTDLRCDHCGEANFELRAGLETPKILSCPKCREYHYFVGDIWCTNYGDGDLDEKKARALLRGSTTLRPGVTKALRNQRRRLGLPDLPE